MLAVIAVITAIAIGYNLSKPSTPVSSSSVTDAATKPARLPTKSVLLKLVNQQRAKSNISPLREDNRLGKSAQKRADDLVSAYSVSGTITKKPDDFGVTWRLIAATGLQCLDVDENVASNSGTALQRTGMTIGGTIGGWIGQPDEFKIMTNPAYNLTGFGLSSVAVVEHFCETTM